MSNGLDNANVLIAECESAINDIKTAAPAKSCNAHEPLSRGVIVLLRCQKAELDRAIAGREADIKARAALLARLKDKALGYAVGGLALLALLAVGAALGKGPLVARFIRWIVG